MCAGTELHVHPSNASMPLPLCMQQAVHIDHQEIIESRTTHGQKMDGPGSNEHMAHKTTHTLAKKT
jgi:hypothetical protein